MYVSRNYGVRGRTTVARASAPGLGGIFSKIKKAIEKIHPKELSPTRLLQDAQKKKAQDAAKKLEATEAERAAANAAAEAATAAEIARLQAQAAAFQAPGVTQPFPLVSTMPATSNLVPQFGAGTPTASAAPAEDDTLLYAGIAGVGLLAAYLLLRKKGK